MERGRLGTLCSRACGSFVIVFPLVGQLYLIMMEHYIYVYTALQYKYALLSIRY
jgi:hypothetical protein